SPPAPARARPRRPPGRCALRRRVRAVSAPARSRLRPCRARVALESDEVFRPRLRPAARADRPAPGGRARPAPPTRPPPALRPRSEPARAAALPPYSVEPLADPERYQTVYARESGSAAAPTAGLHFTPELLDRLDVERVTLHVGLDTFRPLTVDDLDDHVLH